MKSNEEELIGMPTSEVPRMSPGEDCNAKRWEKRGEETIFVGYCDNGAGKGTDHFGEGRCKHHAGSSLKGEEHPNFEHGLFSDFLSDDDREELEAIEQQGNLGNLQSTINYEFLRLRRAVRNLEGEDDDDQSFWDAYNEIIQSASETGLGNEEIASLAELLDASYGAFAKRIESLRKLVKTYEELTEGRKVNIDGDMSHTHAGEEGGAPISVEWRESEAENEESDSDE
jgi:hypothetical protein